MHAPCTLGSMHIWLLLISVWQFAQVCLGLTLLADETGVIFDIVTAENLPLTLTSYLSPILMCLCTKERLLPGPWNTGTLGPLVRSLAAAYVTFTMLVSMLPGSFPTSMANPPYAAIMWLACILVMLICWWMPKIGGRHYYSGPISASIGTVAFAITSPLLIPTTCPPWWVRFFGRVPSEAFRSQGAKQHKAAGLQASTDLKSEVETPRWETRGWLSFWPGQCLRPRSDDRPEDVRLSPTSFYRQPELRIPGEREALRRAQKSPMHSTGYAWDGEAAKRLGHGSRVATSQKRIPSALIAECTETT